jgi:hypothetical protein
MARTLTIASKTALYSQSTGAVLPILLELYHTYAGIASPVYLCSNNVDLVYGGNTYTAYAFRFDPPDMTQEGNANARLVIDSTDQTIIEVLRSITVPPTIVARAMFYNDTLGVTTFEELVPWSFTVRNVVADVNTISGDLIYEDRRNNQMGPVEFTAQMFPGVH